MKLTCLYKQCAMIFREALHCAHRQSRNVINGLQIVIQQHMSSMHTIGIHLKVNLKVVVGKLLA